MPEPFERVKAVFFDVDDTLYDFHGSMDLAFEHLHKAFPEVLGRHAPERIREAYWGHYHGVDHETKLDLIQRDVDLYRRSMWAGALAALGCDEDKQACGWLQDAHPHVEHDFAHPDGFARVLTQEFMRARPEHWRGAMYPGAQELLAALRGARILGAITNGPSVLQRPKLEALRYRDHFPEHLVFVGGEFGRPKPDAAIFQAAAKAAGVAPEECLMIGDAREYDMPAKAVGFRTILFCGGGRDTACDGLEHPPDAVVTSHHEIRKLLGV